MLIQSGSTRARGLKLVGVPEPAEEWKPGRGSAAKSSSIVGMIRRYKSGHPLSIPLMA